MHTWIHISILYIIYVYTNFVSRDQLNLIHLLITRIINLENTVDNSRNPCCKLFFLKYYYDKTLIIKTFIIVCLLHAGNASTLQKKTHFICII